MLSAALQMLSEELEAHYVSLLNVLAATGVGAPETMRLVYLLLLQERVPEAVRLFNTLSVGEGLQGVSMRASRRRRQAGCDPLTLPLAGPALAARARAAARVAAAVLLPGRLP